MGFRSTALILLIFFCILVFLCWVVCCFCCVNGTKSDFASIVPFASASFVNCPIVNCRLATSMMFPASFGVFCRLQFTDFDSFLRFFLFHFTLLSRWFGLL